MEVDQIKSEARKIWGERKHSLSEIVALLGVVNGDLCRQARAQLEGKGCDTQELKKELGNIIASTIRWCDDLGFGPNECVALALDAQRRYAAKISK